MHLVRRHAALLALVLLSACATVPPGGVAPTSAAATDPWENWNRKVFVFNDAVDEAVLKPVATAWRDNVPALVRHGVSNFFGNVRVQTFSRVILPGNPDQSRFLLKMLHPDAGGSYTHNGPRRFQSRDDPEYRMLAAWIRGERYYVKFVML